MDTVGNLRVDYLHCMQSGYYEKIGHLSLSRIEIDIDYGLKANYRKLQIANEGKLYEVLADSNTITKKEK